MSAPQEGATDTQTDGVLQLRLDNAKLLRSEAALRAKGSSLEEALKALEARLSEYEAQAMAQHAALEHGKHQVRGHEAFGRSEICFTTSALFLDAAHIAKSDTVIVRVTRDLCLFGTHIPRLVSLKSPSCRLCLSSAQCLRIIGLPTHTDLGIINVLHRTHACCTELRQLSASLAQ